MTFISISLRRHSQCGRNIDFRPFERPAHRILQSREGPLRRADRVQNLQLGQRPRYARCHEFRAVIAARFESPLGFRIDVLSSVVHRPTGISDPLEREAPLPDSLVDLLVGGCDDSLEMGAGLLAVGLRRSGYGIEASFFAVAGVQAVMAVFVLMFWGGSSAAERMKRTRRLREGEAHLRVVKSASRAS